MSSESEDEPSSSARAASARPSLARAKHIPLPPPFRLDGGESFQLWARRYEVIQEARYRDTGTDVDAALAAELPTRLHSSLFLVWDNLPKEIQDDYKATKKHLQKAFGQKDIIASFQTFANSRHRLPNESLDVYAADICRLVKEAFPDFEPNASEYMKLSRFVAGLDQELQIKCHERGVKTLKEALEIATQAERARQAAKLTMPLPPTNNTADMVSNLSVTAVSNTDMHLQEAVHVLTDTIKDLSRDMKALKLQINTNEHISHRDIQIPDRSQRSPSPYREGRDRYVPTRSPAHSPDPQRSHARYYSPGPKPQYASDSNRDMYSSRRGDEAYYRHRPEDYPHDSSRYTGPSPRGYRNSQYSPDRYSDYRQAGRTPYPSNDRHCDDFPSRRRSPSPGYKRVSFQNDQDQQDRRQGNFH